MYCQNCKNTITNKVAKFSLDKFGTALCYNCQQIDLKPKLSKSNYGNNKLGGYLNG